MHLLRGGRVEFFLLLVFSCAELGGLGEFFCLQMGRMNRERNDEQKIMPNDFEAGIFF